MSPLARLVRSLRSEHGQVLPLVVVSAFVLIGFTGLAIDLGRVWVAKQQLQRAVDAATLAAGQNLPDTSAALTAAQDYAANGTRNPLSGWGVAVDKPSVTFECNSSGPDYTAGSTPTCFTDSSGSNCDPSSTGSATVNAALPAGATTCNEVRISESATVRTGLLSLFIPSFKVTATSTAAARGTTGLPKPMNIFVILDTTGSMGSDCSASVSGISGTPKKLDCAKAGVRALLQAMPETGGTADDDVGIMVFPALATTLTGTVTSTGSFSGTTTSRSTTVTVSANESRYVGYTITGTGIPSGTTITAATATTVTLSQKATSSGTHSFTVTQSTYSLPTTPPITPPDAETDCSSRSTFPVTYPPFEEYAYSAGSTGGIPSSVLGNFTNYTSPGYIDNYPGYEAVPLASDYLNSDGSLNTSSNLVKSVYWAQCSGGTYPGGDYYGIKDISGQGSYLAGAIAEAQYALASQPQTRTVDGNSYSVTNAIIILSDGEINNPNSGVDGVDPGANGNVGFTSDTPCEDALSAATAAKTAGTLIFSIAYDDSGQSCQDSGNGTGPSSLSSCAAPTSGSNAYSGTGPYDGSACSFMNYLASGSTDFASQSDAGDLTQAFTQAATELTTGNSILTPDCSNPPNCSSSSSG